jgi:hypothetical protein
MQERRLNEAHARPPPPLSADRRVRHAAGSSASAGCGHITGAAAAVSCGDQACRPPAASSRSPVALRAHLAGGDVESGEESGGAMTLVVVGSSLDLVWLERQQRLSAIQSLDLRHGALRNSSMAGSAASRRPPRIASMAKPETSGGVRTDIGGMLQAKFSRLFSIVPTIAL